MGSHHSIFKEILSPDSINFHLRNIRYINITHFLMIYNVSLNDIAFVVILSLIVLGILLIVLKICSYLRDREEEDDYNEIT